MVALYFLPHGNLRYCLAFPAAVLTFGSLLLASWPLTLALLACTMGDVMGVLGSFPGQMGGFAVAHVFFIVLLRRSIIRQHINWQIWAPVITVVLAFLVAIGWLVAPSVPGALLKVGCMVYALLLLSVFGLAMIAALACRNAEKSVPISIVRRHAVIAAVGAALFVFSDFVLAWNLFVERVPHAHYYIMCTYYAALLLLFIALRGEEKVVAFSK